MKKMIYTLLACASIGFFSCTGETYKLSNDKVKEILTLVETAANRLPNTEDGNWNQFFYEENCPLEEDIVCRSSGFTPTSTIYYNNEFCIEVMRFHYYLRIAAFDYPEQLEKPDPDNRRRIKFINNNVFQPIVDASVKLAEQSHGCVIVEVCETTVNLYIDGEGNFQMRIE